MKKKKIIFIASTGGHLNELFQLKPLFKKYDSYIITENTKSNKNLKEKYPKKVNFLIPGTYTSLFSKLIYPFKLFLNCWISLYLIIKINPNIVITTGAHNVGPMCCLAKLFRKKLIFIETFANSISPTKTGKIIYKFADVFIVQWESMLEFYPNAVYGGWIY